METNSAVLLIFVSVLIGSMCFFAATVAPTIFRVLPAASAGLFLRAFFPVYYLWGLTIAAIALLVSVTVDWYAAAACLVVALLFGYARQRLMPRINQARDDEMDAKLGADKRFQALHLTSVVINAVQVLLLVAVAAYLMWIV